MSKYSNGASLLAVAYAIGLASSGAHAQEAAAEPNMADIVVTAQRRSESLQNVPIAVSAFQGDALNAQNVDELLELAKVTPSLVIPEGGSQSVPYIRGVGGRAITPGNESTAAVYVDGVYQTDKTGIMLQSFPEVQSVQVLRGPQGTLFGRNATSGAILISTRKPGDELGMMLEGTFGTADRRARGYVEFPLAESLSGSVSGFYNYKTAYITNRNPAAIPNIGHRTGDEETYGFRGKLVYDNGPFSAEVQGNYINGYTTAILALQPIKGTPLSIGDAVSLPLGINIREPKNSYYGEVAPETRYETYGGALKLNYDAGIGIQSTTAYTVSKSGVQLDLDLSPVPVFFFDTDLKGHSFQQEFLLSSDKTSKFQWIAGAFFIDYRDGYNALDQFVGLNVPKPFRQNTIPQQLLDYSAAGAGPTSGLAYINQNAFVSIRSLGLFADGSYQLTDALKLSVGARYTTEKHKLDGDNQSTTYVPDGAGGVIAIPTTAVGTCDASPTCDSLSAPFKKLTYRAVLDFKASDDALFYASYNRGFKSGVYNISTVTNVEATDPETIDAFEIGMKTKLFDRRLTLNLAGYYYKYNNLQVVVVDATTNTQKSINAAKATISGLEAELAFNPSKALSLNATFSTFFESKYDSFKNCEIYRAAPGAGLSLLTNGDCTGQDMPVTPNIMASLTGTYSIELPNDSRIDLGGLISYIDKMDLQVHGYYPAGTDAAGPYAAGEGRAPIQRSMTSLNLSATFHPPGGKFYASVWGEDLLGQSKRLNRNLQTTSFGYATAYGRGMTAGVTIGMKLGSMR
jgi:iron complex outermembrane receptor protein